jgi:uncharacterized glyoxalase superfamily protein PhnB
MQRRCLVHHFSPLITADRHYGIDRRARSQAFWENGRALLLTPAHAAVLYRSPMAPGTLDAVGLVVSDLARSISFYRLLGAPFPEGAEDSEQGHAEAELAGGFRLMLDTEDEMRSFDPDWQPPTGNPRAAIAFRCGSPGDVDALFAEALKAGGTAHKEPWDAFWGQHYAQLRDPDGNAVDLYASLR